MDFPFDVQYSRKLIKQINKGNLSIMMLENHTSGRLMAGRMINLLAIVFTQNDHMCNRG